MVIHYHNNDNPGGSGKEKKNAENKPVAINEDTCRCKETSKMTPRELLRLMISDLAFWKDAKKR